MTQLQLKTASGFVDPADVQVKTASGWTGVNKVHVFTSSGWTEVWPLGSGGSVNIVATSSGIQLLGFGSPPYNWVNDADVTATFPIDYVFDFYFYMCTDNIYVDTFNEVGTFYLVNNSTAAEYNLGNYVILSTETENIGVNGVYATIQSDTFVTMAGYGTYTMKFVTTINGTQYTFTTPQKLIISST